MSEENEIKKEEIQNAEPEEPKEKEPITKCNAKPAKTAEPKAPKSDLTFSFGKTRLLVVIMAIIILLIIVVTFKVGSKADMDKLNQSLFELNNKVKTVTFNLAELQKKIGIQGALVTPIPCKGICPISGGLYVRDAKVVLEGKQMILSGEFINGASLKIEDAVFRFVHDKEHKFTVRSIDPGASTGFSVVLDGVKKTVTQGAFVLDSAKIHYHQVMTAGMEQ